MSIGNVTPSASLWPSTQRKASEPRARGCSVSMARVTLSWHRDRERAGAAYIDAEPVRLNLSARPERPLPKSPPPTAGAILLCYLRRRCAFRLNEAFGRGGNLKVVIDCEGYRGQDRLRRALCGLGGSSEFGGGATNKGCGWWALARCSPSGGGVAALDERHHRRPSKT